MQNIIFNIPLYYTGITTTHIYTALTHKLTTSVAQSVERWSRDPESQVQFSVDGDLGLGWSPRWVFQVYLSDTRIYL